MRARMLALAALLLAAVPAGAQESPIVIRAGRLLDGRGGVAEGVSVAAAGSRIARSAAPGAPATDHLSGLTPPPGGIDTHAHPTPHPDPDGRPPAASPRP